MKNKFFRTFAVTLAAVLCPQPDFEQDEQEDNADEE